MARTETQPPQSKFSIIISCFNEEKNIVELLDRISKAVPCAQVIVVHGGTDRTGELASGFSHRIRELTVVYNLHDRGKGHGVKVGIDHAKYDFLLNIDADLQFDPEEIPVLIDALDRGGCDLVHGSRYLKRERHLDSGEKKTRSSGNWLLSMYASLLTGRTITDVNAGFISWRRRFMEDVPFEDDRFCWEAEWIVKCVSRGRKFLEVPVTFRSREAGSSMHRSTFDLLKGGARFILWLTKAHLAAKEHTQT